MPDLQSTARQNGGFASALNASRGRALGAQKINAPKPGGMLKKLLDKGVQIGGIENSELPQGQVELPNNLKGVNPDAVKQNLPGDIQNYFGQKKQQAGANKKISELKAMQNSPVGAFNPMQAMQMIQKARAIASGAASGGKEAGAQAKQIAGQVVQMLTKQIGVAAIRQFILTVLSPILGLIGQFLMIVFLIIIIITTWGYALKIIIHSVAETGLYSGAFTGTFSGGKL